MNIFSLIRFFKYYKLNESLNFKTKIENHQTNHSYNTRHSIARNLNCPNFRLSKLKTSFLYNSIKFWNKIPSDIKSAQNLNHSKNILKKATFMSQTDKPQQLFIHNYFNYFPNKSIKYLSMTIFQNCIIVNLYTVPCV